jgi:hypothetical protein
LTNIVSLKHPAWTNGVGPKSWGGRHILPSNHQNKTLRKDHKRFLTGTIYNTLLMSIDLSMMVRLLLRVVLIDVLLSSVTQSSALRTPTRRTPPNNRDQDRIGEYRYAPNHRHNLAGSLDFGDSYHHVPVGNRHYGYDDFRSDIHPSTSRVIDHRYCIVTAQTEHTSMNKIILRT